MAARSISLLLPSSNLSSSSNSRRIGSPGSLLSLSSLSSLRSSGLSSSPLSGVSLLRSTNQMPRTQRRRLLAMVAANSTPPTAQPDSVPADEASKQSDGVPADETSKQSEGVPAVKTPKQSARLIKSLALGEMEARKLKYPTTGTEAFLMGILFEGTNVAANFLRAYGISLFKVRDEAVKLLGKGDKFFVSPMIPPWTEQAHKALDRAVEEKMKFGEDGELTTTHLLLGIWGQKESAGHKILAALGFNDEKAKELAKFMNADDAVVIDT